MKIALALLLVGLAAFFAGCRSKPNSAPQDTVLVQRALDAIVPRSHEGYFKGVHKNQYFDLEVEADGLKWSETAGWTWTWLTYNRTSHFPLFSGLTWSSTGQVTLGRKP